MDIDGEVVDLQAYRQKRLAAQEEARTESRSAERLASALPQLERLVARLGGAVGKREEIELAAVVGLVNAGRQSDAAERLERLCAKLRHVSRYRGKEEGSS